MTSSAQPTPTPWLRGCVCVLLGVGLQLQQPALSGPITYMLLMATGLVLFALLAINSGVVFQLRLRLARALVPVLVPVAGRYAQAWRSGLILLALALMGFASTGWRATAKAAQALPASLEGRDLVLTGRIAAMPQVSEMGWRLRFEVEQAELNGSRVQVPQRVDLGWYNAGGVQRAWPDVRASDRWQFTVRLKAPHGSRNPHGFDFELWLWEQGVGANGYVRDGPKDVAPKRLGTTWYHPVERARQAVRDRIFAQARTTPDAVAPAGAPVPAPRLEGVVAALVVGDQRAISQNDWDVFRATGVAHLMSISGLHITLFAWAMAAVLRAVWRLSPWLCLRLPAPQAAMLGGLVLAGLYALFSGWGVPAQRTVGMLAVAVLLPCSGLRWPWTLVWALAALGVVLADPWALMQAGFWLSFVAVGVLLASDARDQGAQPLLQRAWQMLREQWVITLALTPLTLLLFGQVSAVGLVANALAIPWVTWLVTPLSLLGVVWSPCWQAAHSLLVLLSQVLQTLAELPWAMVSVPQAPWWAGLAGVVGGLMLVMRWPWAMRLAGLPLLLPVIFWQAPRPASGEFSLLAADVGQGNAVLVQTATHNLLYDAGPQYATNSDAGHRVLLPLMRALDIELDTLVLSHRDADHTGGAASVLAQQPRAEVLSSMEPEHALQTVRPAQRCEAGQSWVWDGVRFEILHPSATDYETLRRSNALSCVLKISTPQRAALLVGDIEKAQELALVAQGANLRADVLLVPHHGSKTSSTPAFIEAVNPRFALVQAGYRNRYGHPAPVVMDRYDERGITVLDSPRCGAASWSSDQADKVDCHRQTHKRYWQNEPPLRHLLR